MLGFIKKLFGTKPTEAITAPYKVETPVVLPVAGLTLTVEGAGAVEIKPAVKKTAKTATARKPRAPKV